MAVGGMDAAISQLLALQCALQYSLDY